MGLRPLMVALVVVVWLSPQTAHGQSAQDWSQPVALSAAAIPPSVPLRVVVARERVVFALRNGALERAVGDRQLAPVVIGGSTYAPSIGNAAVAASPSGRTVVAGFSTDETDPRSHTDAVILSGTAAGRLRLVAKPRIATSGAAVFAIAAETNDRGDAVIVFEVCRHGGCTLKGLYRRHGGSFGPVRALGGPTTVPAVALALNASGRALLFYEVRAPHTRRTTLRWRVHDGTSGWGREQTLSGRRFVALSPYPLLAASVSIAGRGTVAFEDVQFPTLLAEAAEILPDGHAGRRQLLETSETSTFQAGALPPPGIRTSTDENGDPLVAWTGVKGGSFVVRATPVFAPDQPATIGDDSPLVLQDLVRARRGPGVAIIARTAPVETPPGPEPASSRIVVSLRSSRAGAFGPVSQVVDSAAGVFTAVGDLSSNPTRMAVAWSAGSQFGPIGPVLVSERAGP